ncbi:MAG TPA: c-type cytochrome [Kofleriaceae bacterium]|nr:c-type cytochrome [Kofleriaceae bacterium]
MTRAFPILLSFVLAACGGSKPAPKTTPVEPTTPPSEPVATGSATAPTPPAEPPTEPAPAEPAKDPKAELLAAETTAWDKAKPVFEKYCASCHTKAGKKSAKKKLDHFDMDSYPPGGHHTATIGFTIRDVLGISGKKATMPYDHPGTVKGDDLAAIKAWTDAWEAAEKGGAHPAKAKS